MGNMPEVLVSNVPNCNGTAKIRTGFIVGGNHYALLSRIHSAVGCHWHKSLTLN